MQKLSVLITGANSGFGKLIALNFARGGYHVYASARNLKSSGVVEITKIVSAEKLSLEWLEIDVTNQSQIDTAYTAIKDRGLDILINNAGFGILGPLEEYTVTDFQRQFDTNFFGVVRMTYTFLPLLKKSNFPKIITISSIAGLIVAPAYGLYASSKHAVEVFMETLSYEMFKSKLKISLVAPGGFDTNFTLNGQGLKNREENNWYSNILEFRNRYIGGENKIYSKKRDPQHVADLVFAISQKTNPRLRYIIGQGAFLAYFFRKILPAMVWAGSIKAVLAHFSAGKAKVKSMY